MADIESSFNPAAEPVTMLSETDEDRHARIFAEAMSNEMPDPFGALKINIDDLFDEAKNWLDGAEIKTQAEADSVATLIDRLRKAWKAADDQRDLEKRPHMEAANAVQAKYKPLLTRATTAKEVAESAQTKYLKRLRKIQQDLADAAAAEALKLAEAARDAIQEANANADLVAREKAEDMVADARALLADAAVLTKAKPQAKGEGAARAIGLKSEWKPALTDGLLAMRHYWVQPARRAEIEELMLTMAKQDVRAGKREIPGFAIEEDFRV